MDAHTHVQLTRPILFYDQSRKKKGDPCEVLRSINSAPGMPILIEVRFSDGHREFVRETDVEPTD